MTVYWEVRVGRHQWQPDTTEIYALRRRLTELDGNTPVLTGEGWRLPDELSGDR